MENLWKLIEAASETELHDLAQAAKSEWADIKEKIEAFEKSLAGEEYQPQEYPKMVGNAIAHNAEEEEKLLAAAKP